MYNDYLGLADDGGLGGGGDLVPRAGDGFLFLLLLVVLEREKFNYTGRFENPRRIVKIRCDYFFTH